MTPHTLAVLLDGQHIGAVTRTGDRLRFAYDDAWRRDPQAYPLSLSMPLTTAEHPHEVIDAWLWGLLPDNEFALARWGRQFHVSSRNAFALLTHVGEDCAGAVQLLPPERVEQVLATPDPPIQWLTEDDIAERLRALRSDAAAGRRASDAGQFSLAGAQPKTALIFRDGRWGIPSGRVPTTHILKPPTGTVDGHAENEHFCLMLARELGLPAVTSEVRRFGDQTAIVVERYDRLALPDRIARIHQEDLCQSLGVPPTRKYESEGGPGATDIVRLLRERSSRPDDDVARFIDALAFNWLIGGSDAHAKNYAVLLADGGQVRLAPLYDVASALPYGHDRQLKLAMKIGGHYALDEISGRHWRRLLVEAQLEPRRFMDRTRQLASNARDALETVRAKVDMERLSHPIFDRLVARITNSSSNCIGRIQA